MELNTAAFFVASRFDDLVGISLKQHCELQPIAFRVGVIIAAVSGEDHLGAGVDPGRAV